MGIIRNPDHFSDAVPKKGGIGQLYAALPASSIAEDVNEKLRQGNRLVVTAPPGAGKSTLLPLTILEGMEQDGNGRILMLEPRRIAARQIAERMASMTGGRAGGKVGYRVRFESRVSSDTRIEVLTEGILTRMILNDPALDGVTAVIFDEFHERSLTSDEALALVLETQKVIRPDLKIVIMSATIDAGAICGALDAPLVESGGRMYPVRIYHGDEIADVREAPEKVAHWIRLAHRQEHGDILAFLPGEAEIRRCGELLRDGLGDTDVMPLYGMLPFDEQRRAIEPSGPGRRKVVLATPIAETSLTIEGIRIVVDSGLCRRMVFNPRSGLSSMETVRISMDMANQRSGRAGRLCDGVCYRLWSLATESRMADCRMPEINCSDLSSLVLDAAAWGERDLFRLQWITPPPKQAVVQAGRTLSLLGALDKEGRITPEGRRIAALPCHPRIARMLLNAQGASCKALAADIAALLEERDPMGEDEDNASITDRIGQLRKMRSEGRSTRGWARIARTSAQYLRLAGAKEDNAAADPFTAGAVIAPAYPERIAKAHPDGCGKFILAGGETVCTGKDDPLAACGWIAVASVNVRKEGTGRVFLAAPVSVEDLMPLARTRENIFWDNRKGALTAQSECTVGCHLIEARPLGNLPAGMAESVICEAVGKYGTGMLDFNDDVRMLQRRVAAVASWHPEYEIPDLGTDAVLGRAAEWLPPFISGCRDVAALKKVDLAKALWSILDYRQQTEVERMAPTHIEVPSGSRIKVEYRQGAEAPVLRVRLQECFGLTDTPRVDGGRRPVLMELLSPGFKPVQLTSDLRSFWAGTYFEVRKELRRRYPKHSWPDNPLEAEAVRGVRHKP